jgi:hypothetical protein
MPSPRNSRRKIVVDEVEFRWTRRFNWTRRHGEQARACMEMLCVWRADRTGGRLLIRFVDGESGVTTAGSGWGGHDGGLLVGDRSYNLNRPAVVAALIRQAMREGWSASSKGQREIEGFALLARSDAPQGHL